MTTVSRPNREALDKALNIFRDAMRPFIVRHLRQVRGSTVEESIKRSLPDRKVVYFEQNLGNKGGNIAASIDVNDFPHLVQRNWRETFAAAFGYANNIRGALWQIADVRNQIAHPGHSDLEIELVRARMFDIADLLKRINAPEEAEEVSKIGNNLTVMPPTMTTAENQDVAEAVWEPPAANEAFEQERDARMERQFAGHTFKCVGQIQPERDRSGEPIKYSSGAMPDVPLNNYGQGPFCQFSVAKGPSWRLSGVFVVTCDEAVRSVGETVNLARFWNLRGRITPAAVRKQGGQQTHCRINSLILDEAKRGADIVLWFRCVHHDTERKGLKKQLLNALDPPWDRIRPQFPN